MSACNMISCVGCIQNTESILLLSDHSMASDMLLYKLAWKRVGKHTSSQILSSYINVFILTSRIGECCICRPLGCHARTGQAQGMSIVLKVMGLNPTLNDFFFCWWYRFNSNLIQFSCANVQFIIIIVHVYHLHFRMRLAAELEVKQYVFCTSVSQVAIQGS